MIKIILDKEVLEHGYISLYAADDVGIDEDLSNEILSKTPCYDLAVSPKGELIELECDIEDLDKIDTHLFSGNYEIDGKILNFKGLIEFVKNHITPQKAIDVNQTLQLK